MTKEAQAAIEAMKKKLAAAYPKGGAQLVAEGIISTAAEYGYRLGRAEAELEKAKRSWQLYGYALGAGDDRLLRAEAKLAAIIKESQ